MKINKQERNSNEVTVEVEAAPSEFAEEKEAVLKSFARRVKIPGFRPGKAPRALVEQHLGAEAHAAEATQNLIAKLYTKMIQEIGVEPIDQGKVSNLQNNGADGKDPLIITYTVPVAPEVTVTDYKGIPIPPIQTEVSAEEIEQVLTNLQERLAAYPEVTDRAAREGDLVEIDVAANQADGTPYEPLTRKGAGLLLGQGNITPAFDEALVSTKTGERKTFSVTFPKDFHDATIQDATLTFAVTVNKIAEKKLPVLDDAFAKRVGGEEIGSLDTLKARIQENLQTQKKQEGEAAQRNQALEKVVEKVSITLPEPMIQRESNVILEELKESLARDKLSLDQYLQMVKKDQAQLMAELREGATRRVTSKLVLEAIARQENLSVSNEALEEEITRLATAGQKTVEDFKKTLSSGGEQYIRKYLLRQQALAWLLSHAVEQAEPVEDNKKKEET